MAHERTIQVFADAGALASAAAELFVRQAGAMVAAHGRFTVALAGGTTPNALYDLLASVYRSSTPWHAIHFFWGDERHVPPDHRDSNFRAASEAMLDRVPVPPAHVHRILGELPNAADAAADYEQKLRGEPALGAALPVFDLVLLGMGPDGHTASLFPDSEPLYERDRLVVAPWVEKVRSFRITLTLPVLNSAAMVVFLVSGVEKAETLRAVLKGSHQPIRLPAQAVRPSKGHLRWFVDAAAALRLSARGVGT
jgi:6-phosphogluconolactonase